VSARACSSGSNKPALVACRVKLCKLPVGWGKGRARYYMQSVLRQMHERKEKTGESTGEMKAINEQHAEQESAPSQAESHAYSARVLAGGWVLQRAWRWRQRIGSERTDGMTPPLFRISDSLILISLSASKATLSKRSASAFTSGARPAARGLYSGDAASGMTTSG
jgi:hypothetical protein